MREGNLNQFQKLELVQTKASNHNVIKQEFNNNIKSSYSLDMNNHLLNNLGKKEKTN